MAEENKRQAELVNSVELINNSELVNDNTTQDKEDIILSIIIKLHKIRNISNINIVQDILRKIGIEYNINFDNLTGYDKLPLTHALENYGDIYHFKKQIGIADLNRLIKIESKLQYYLN